MAQLLQLTSHTQDMRAHGLEPTSKLLEITIERLCMADGEPMAVEATHLVTSRFPALAKQLAGAESLYQLLREEYGVELAEAEETIETGLAVALAA